jgi:hypothetical protein
VLEVFQNFKYHRTFVDGDQRAIVLEFSATIGVDHLKGVSWDVAPCAWLSLPWQGPGALVDAARLDVPPTSPHF